jgi:hypothetical protein
MPLSLSASLPVTVTSVRLRYACQGRALLCLDLIFIFWLVCHQVAVNDPATGAEVSGVDYYFVMQDGSKFKVISDAIECV